MGWIAQRAQSFRTWRRAEALSLLNVFALATVFLFALAIFQAIELRRDRPVIEWGSVSDAFAACGTILAVIVALRQAAAARKQAAADGKDAAERLERELAAAEDRHRDQLREQREVAAIEVENQVKLARVQRMHIREQDFKNALIRITVAAGAYTHELATLMELGKRLAKLSGGRRQPDDLRDVSKLLGRHVQDCGLEIAGAHMLTQDNDIHAALNRVQAALALGPQAEIVFRNALAVPSNGVPEVTAAAGPIFMATEEIHARLTDARQLAVDRLIAGWD